MDASKVADTADLFDAHCHIQDVRLLPVANDVVRDSVLRHVRFLATNGTSESDWDLVTDVFREHADCVIPSYGLHPWCGAGTALDSQSLVTQSTVSLILFSMRLFFWSKPLIHHCTVQSTIPDGLCLQQVRRNTF